MAALTTLGIVHTAASLVALVSGFTALARCKEILPTTRLGQVYLGATLITAASALGIFQHAGFGPGHALAIATLLALAIGTVAATTNVFGGAARYVQAASFSSTILFHLIPGFTEALTRLPFGAPLLPSAQAPVFKAIYAALAVVFALAFTAQVRWLLRQRAG
jgi:uncharacterized membrane protein